MRKRIKLFEDFHKINEAEEELVDDAPVDTEGDDDSEEEVKKDVEKPERMSAVVTKEFFNELEHHVYYWFRHGEIGKMFDLIDINQERRGVTIWCSEKVEDINEQPEYMWKVKYFETAPLGKIKKMEDVTLNVTVYNFDKTVKLKETEIIITIKKINEDFLLDRMRRVRKRIVKDPTTEEEKDKFMKRQHLNLTDGYY